MHPGWERADFYVVRQAVSILWMAKSWELCSLDLHLPSDRYRDW